ncbi:MAG TPA: class I fructose-bisphosphate aldolase family protein [Syntrophomonadaceae bacterium]|nr:class I fructose-bisphosphate aldolase family protein [Syntrophomonadaceae bacterium]
MIGKEIRLKRLFKRSRRVFIVPMDHGVTMGPMPGLEDIRQAVKSVAEGGADAVILHKGLARRITKFINPGGCELIVHLSASTALSPDSSRKEAVCSVEHAIRLGATAVSAHVNLGGQFEAQMLRDLGRISEECEVWGMPLLAMMYVRDGTPGGEYDPARICHAARIAEELGADIVKVNYTGSPETFARVTASVNIPVVIAGGPKMSSTAELLTMISDAVKAGARGVAIGRNVFQDSNPALLAAAVRQVLDHNPAEQAVGELLPFKAKVKQIYF